MTLNLPAMRHLNRADEETAPLLHGFRQQIASGIGSGTTEDIPSGVHPEYRSRYVEFAEDMMGVQLTPDQKKLFRAVEKYEIVQVSSATGVGKTYALGVLAIAIYKTHLHSKIYTACAPPEDNLRNLLWGEILTFVNTHAHLFQGDRIQVGNLNIQRQNRPKQFIAGVTIPQSRSEDDMETRFSGKHSPTLMFIFDEGDGIPDAVYKGADGCMSGGVFMRQVVCFNPKKKKGEPYRRIKEHRCYHMSMSAFSHPNVITGENIFPGAVTREATVKRINEWTEPLRKSDDRDGNCFDVPEFLVGVRATSAGGDKYPPLPSGIRRVIDQQFWYKVAGEYPRAGASQLFRDEWLDRAISKWELFLVEHGREKDGRARPPRGIRPLMGLDPAGAEGNDSAVIVLRYGNWVSEPIRFNVDPDMAAMKAARIYVEYNCRAAYVDATGLGDGVPQRMGRYGRELSDEYGRRITINAIPVKVAAGTNGYSEEGDFENLRTEAYFMLRKAFRLGDIVIPADARLRESLELLRYEKKPNKQSTIFVTRKKTMLKQLGYSPDYMEALMLTYCPDNVMMGGLK